MEAKAHIPFNKARAFAQATSPARSVLGCLHSVPDCLSGKLDVCAVFSPCFVHDRRYSLYTGSSSKDRIEIKYDGQ